MQSSAQLQRGSSEQLTLVAHRQLPTLRRQSAIIFERMMLGRIWVFWIRSQQIIVTSFGVMFSNFCFAFLQLFLKGNNITSLG